MIHTGRSTFQPTSRRHLETVSYTMDFYFQNGLIISRLFRYKSSSKYLSCRWSKMEQAEVNSLNLFTLCLSCTETWRRTREEQNVCIFSVMNSKSKGTKSRCKPGLDLDLNKIITRLTQPSTLSRTGNEHQPKCGDALWLRSKGRYGSFHLWINVWVAGDPSLTRAIPEHFRDESR